MKCPKCYIDLPKGAKFCLECGSEVATQPEDKQWQSLIGDRRRITALFSDLSGYTAMTERLDPEEVKEITNRIFDGVKWVIRKYDGFVEKFAGDGVLAIFGVPRAHEDDPLRAIQAAREIHELVDALSPRYDRKIGHPLSMHSGVNTGLVVTADVDPEKGTHSITGEAINVASRLSDLAGARGILVGQDTYKASVGHFNFQPLKPTKVKGKSENIAIYKLISEKTAIASVRPEMQISSEMVGRDPELAKLELQILKAVNGQGSVINVFGEPGIGKSRLLAELRQRDVISRVRLLEGRSISIGKNLSFHPIIDLLKQWANIKEDDTQTDASNRLETAIGRVCRDEAGEVFPFVSTMMGMKLSGKHAQRVEGIEGEALEKLILKNVREFLIRSTERTPVVIVMEDLHWADISSLELLESLFGLAQTHRVVFINVFRPGYWEVDNRKIESLAKWLPDVDFVEIPISPLNSQDGKTLVDNMLQVKGLPNPLKQQILDRAGGNPFFIEEVMRSLIDEGVFLRTNGGFEVTENIANVVIPTTINDVLTARIDRLEEQTRDLIKIASVIGRSFFDRILKEVADSIEGVDERLAYLKETQFIRDRMRMEELEHLFKHALAQEAAYESTLIQRRKALHHKVARSIEKVFRGRIHEFYGMLAFHYSKADDLEKAEEYMVKAGEEALRSSASSEALHYFQEALQLYLTKYGQDADVEKLADFEKNIGIALFNKAKWEEAIKYLDSVLERWGAPLPKRGFFGMLRLAFHMLVMMKMIYVKFPNSNNIPGDRDKEIFELFYKASLALPFIDKTRQSQVAMATIARFKKFDSSKMPQVCGLWIAIASIFSLSGKSFKLSNRLLSKTSKEFENRQDSREQLQYNCFTVMIYHCQGEWEKIEQLGEDRFNHLLRLGDLWYVAHYLWFGALVRGEIGEFDHLMTGINRLHEIGKACEYSNATILAQLLRVDYLIRSKRAHEALSQAEEGILYARERSTEYHEIMFMAFKAESQQLSGDAEGARALIAQAKELCLRQTASVWPLFHAPYVAARLFINVDQLEHAICSEASQNIADLQKQVREAGKVAVKNARKYAPYRTKIFRLMGLYHWLIGKQGNALKLWDKTIDEGERLGARPDLARTYFEVGKRLLEPQSKYNQLHGIDGKGYLQKAKRLFKEMDLGGDLDDLDSFKAQHGLWI